MQRVDELPRPCQVLGQHLPQARVDHPQGGVVGGSDQVVHQRQVVDPDDARAGDQFTGPDGLARPGGRSANRGRALLTPSRDVDPSLVQLPHCRGQASAELSRLGHRRQDGLHLAAAAPQLFGMASPRITEPHEVAAVVTFLISGAAARLVGADVVIDGGTIKTPERAAATSQLRRPHRSPPTPAGGDRRVRQRASHPARTTIAHRPRVSPA